MDKNNIYISLDEARAELKKRWQNVELRKRVEEELGENFWLEFKNKPRGFLGRQLPSPDNGFTFFVQLAHYTNTVPLTIEYLDDIFVSFNEEKKGLGRIHVVRNNTDKCLIDIIDFHANEKKKINEILTLNGEKLIDFHHKLLELSKYNIERKDLSDWIHHIGKSDDYYYSYLLHFITHGILFEYFLENDETENSFINRVVFPTIEKINNKFELKPLIVRLYPENQSDEEDFYWWSYPPYINDYLVEYAKKNSLPFKKVL